MSKRRNQPNQQPQPEPETPVSTPASTPMFKVNEDLVVLDEGIPYEGTIMGMIEDKSGAKYKVHFRGWSRRYDKRIVVGQEEGVFFRMPLAQFIVEHKDKICPKFLAEHAKKDTKKKGGPVEDNQEKEKLENNRVKLPKNLVQVLLHDRDMIDKNLVLKFPAAHSIDTIMMDYLASVIPGDVPREILEEFVTNSSQKNVESEFVSVVCHTRGILDYFNTLIGHHLLYKFERPRYNDMVEENSKGKPWKYGTIATYAQHGIRFSADYGFVHLLRLIVKLPELMERMQPRQVLIDTVYSELGRMIKFLAANEEKYYNKELDFESVNPDYYRRATETYRQESSN